MITSAQNEKVKLAHALQSRAKARRKEGRIAMEGARLVRDALQQGLRPDFVLVAPGAEIAFLHAFALEPILISEVLMQEISQTEQPQGILGVFPLPQPNIPPLTTHLLILDSIRDPGNLGTILRAAAGAGVDAALLGPTCVDPYNPKALRAGMGAHFRLPVIEADWEAITAACVGKAVYLADGAGEQTYTAVEWRAPSALIIGGEAEGAGAEARSLAQRRIHIPMSAATESLNAALAAAVILFEMQRQRRA
jgi:TrmH family RNA methyltransferase